MTPQQSPEKDVSCLPVAIDGSWRTGAVRWTPESPSDGQAKGHGDIASMIGSAPLGQELSGSTLVDGASLGSPISLSTEPKPLQRGSPTRQRPAREYHTPPRFVGHPRFAYHLPPQEPGSLLSPMRPSPPLKRQQEPTAAPLQQRVPTPMVPPAFGSRPASPRSMFTDGGDFTFHPDAAFVASSEQQQRLANALEVHASPCQVPTPPFPIAALESEASMRVAVSQVQTQLAGLTQAFVELRDGHGRALVELGAAVRDGQQGPSRWDDSRTGNGAPPSSNTDVLQGSPSSSAARRSAAFPPFLVAKLHEQGIATLREQLSVLEARFDFTFGPPASPTPTSTSTHMSFPPPPSFHLLPPPPGRSSEPFRPPQGSVTFPPPPTSAPSSGGRALEPALMATPTAPPTSSGPLGFPFGFAPPGLPTPVPTPAPTLSHRPSMNFQPPEPRKSGPLVGGSTLNTTFSQGPAPTAPGGWQSGPFNMPALGAGQSYPTIPALRRKTSGFFPPFNQPQPDVPALAHGPARPQDASPISGAELSRSVVQIPNLPPIPTSLTAKWHDLGMTREVLKSLCRYRIGAPTRFQTRTVPSILRGSDVIAQVTSTPERIACYVLPALFLVATNLGLNGAPAPADSTGRGLQVICATATYDQAAQAHRLANGVGGTLGIVAGLCAGAPGEDMASEAERFQRQPPHILLGTVHTLHQLQQLDRLPTSNVALFIIDEIDQIFSRGFAPLLRRLESALPAPAVVSSDAVSVGAFGGRKGRQTAIFSYTWPGECLLWANGLGLVNQVRVLAARDRAPGAAVSSLLNLRQYFRFLPVPPCTFKSPFQPAEEQLEAATWAKTTKADLFCDLLAWLDFSQGLVWCTSTEAVRMLTVRLRGLGIELLSLYHNEDAGSNAELLARFRRSGDGRPVKRVVVAFDGLAKTFYRVHQTSLVINYDVPRSVEDYIHRVACAAQSSTADRQSSVINVLTPGSDLEMHSAIERYYKTNVGALPTDIQFR